MSGGSSQFPDGDSDRTLELWFMFSATPAQYRDQAALFCYGELGVPNREYYLYYSQEFGLTFSNYGQAAGRSDVIRPGDWHQVAVANSGSTLRFYLDGKMVDKKNILLDTAHSNVAYLGGLPEGTAEAVHRTSGYDLRLAQFRGRIALARMYKSALSDENILALYGQVAAAHPGLFPN